MNMKRMALSVAALLLLCSCRQEPDAFSALREIVSAGDCPGFVAYELTSVGEVWSGVGWADVEARQKMNGWTVFRICSMTKSLVGALAAVLADRGVVDLGEPVSRRFPELTGEKAKITLRHCLSMTAGFAELSPSMTTNGLSGLKHEAVLREMASLPLVAPPGTKFVYSNPSYEIVAAVLERTTGKKLSVLLDETFFRPLGMVDTTFFPTEKMRKRLAAVYNLPDEGGIERIPQPGLLREPADGAFESECASAGLFSTPADLARFYRMLARGGKDEQGRQVMSPGALSLISVKQTPPSDACWYSFGFFREDGWTGHGGAFGTMAQYDPATGRVRMLLTQTIGERALEFVRVWRRSAVPAADEDSLTGSRHFKKK